MIRCHLNLSCAQLLRQCGKQDTLELLTAVCSHNRRTTVAGNQHVPKGRCVSVRRNIRYRNDLETACEPINIGQQISEPLGRERRTHDVQARVAESSVRSTKGHERRDGVTDDLRALTLQSRSSPALDVRVISRPDEMVRDQSLRFSYTGMTGIVNGFKNKQPKRRRNRMGAEFPWKCRIRWWQ